MEIIKVKVKKYTGTIESYNELVTDLRLDRDSTQVQFIDENYHSTNLFTGRIMIVTFLDKRSDVSGHCYSPGDHYEIPVECDHEFTPYQKIKEDNYSAKCYKCNFKPIVNR